MDSFRHVMNEPWMWYEDAFFPAPYVTPAHRHNAWQLTASLEGEFFYHIQGRTLMQKPGNWILIAPEISHGVGSDSAHSRAVQIFFRRFPPALLPDAAERFNLRRGVVLTGALPLEHTEALAERFRERTRSDAPFRRSWENTLASEFVLSAVSSHPEEERTKRRRHPEILRVLEYMEAHFQEPLSTEDFAKEAHLSASRFTTLFREGTGSSPMQFFNLIRLGRAQEFLLAGLGVKEAADAAGFATAQYFCRFFRRHTGKSPLDFRRNPFGEEAGPQTESGR